MTVHTRFRDSVAFFKKSNDWCPCRKDTFRQFNELTSEDELDKADCFGFYFVGEPLAAKLTRDCKSFIFKSEAKCQSCNMFMPTKLTDCVSKQCPFLDWAKTTVTARWAPLIEGDLYLKYLDKFKQRKGETEAHCT